MLTEAGRLVVHAWYVLVEPKKIFFSSSGGGSSRVAGSEKEDEDQARRKKRSSGICWRQIEELTTRVLSTFHVPLRSQKCN